MPPPVFRKLRRVRSTKEDGYRTLYFVTDHLGPRRSRSVDTFIDPEHVPDFEGEEAWFELERVKGTPWSYWRAIRQVGVPASARS